MVYISEISLTSFISHDFKQFVVCDWLLIKLTKQVHYCKDVCGVLKEQQDFRDYLNDNDEPKQQKKFTLTDGRLV